MNAAFRVALPLSLLSCATARLPAAPSAASSSPAISFQYSPIFDRVCESALHKPLPAGAADELLGRQQEFRQLWDGEGPELLSAASAVAQTPFAFREAKGALVACDVPSLSLPLTLGMQGFLRSVHPSDARPPRLFVVVLFHEVLHRFVDDTLEARFPAPSPLLTKYAAEPGPVRAHLHLFALQELAYRRLGREKDFAAARTILEAAPGNQEMRAKLLEAIHRAWEIVHSEGDEAFVAELRPAVKP